MKNKYNVILIEAFAIIITLLVLIMIKVPDAKRLAGATSSSTSWITAENWAVRQSAYAYFDRGSAFQYDNTSRGSYLEVHDRSSADFYYSPEDATIEDKKYIDDASFVISLYYDTFADGNGKHYKIQSGKKEDITTGLGLLELTDKNFTYYNSAIAVDRISNPSKNLKANIEKVKKELKAGDIIVYEPASTSDIHALLYIGYDDVMYVTGKSYDYKAKKDNVEPAGAIKTAKLYDDVLANKNKKGIYIFADNIRTISIIRPLNEIKSKPTKTSDYRIASSIKNQLHDNKIVASKKASVGRYHSVDIGDDIKYTITLTNNQRANAAKPHNVLTNSNMDINEIIPRNTILIDVTGNRYAAKNEASNIIHWKNKIPEYKKTTTATYTVKVKDDKSLLGTYIVSDKTNVRKVPLNTIKTLVQRPLSTWEKEVLLEQTKNKIGKSYKSTAELLNQLYLGVTFPITDKLTAMFFNKPSNSYCNGSECYVSKCATNKYIIKDDKTLAKVDKKFTDMLVNGLIGGRLTGINGASDCSSSTPSPVKSKYNDRNKMYTKHTLMVGDVLVVYDSNGPKDTYLAGYQNMYLYLGNATFATVSNGKAIMINATNGERLIDSLLGQDLFYVLRPSHSSDVVKTEYLVYYVSEYDKKYNNNINFGDAKLTYKTADNTTKEISLNDKDVKVTNIEETKSGTDKITVEYKGTKTIIETKIKNKPANIGSNTGSNNNSSNGSNNNTNNEPNKPNIPGSFTSEDNIETPIDTTTNSDNNEINENNNDNTLLYIGIAIVVLTLGYLLILNKDMFKKK